MTVIKADADDRRRTMLVVAIALALGLVGGLWLFNEVQTINKLIAAQDMVAAARRMQWLYLGVSVACAVSATALALYLLRVGSKTQSERRFPPSGSKTFADFKVREGAGAQRIGQGLIALALILVLLAALTVVSGVRSALLLTPPEVTTEPPSLIPRAP